MASLRLEFLLLGITGFRGGMTVYRVNLPKQSKSGIELVFYVRGHMECVGLLRLCEGSHRVLRL